MGDAFTRGHVNERARAIGQRARARLPGQAPDRTPAPRQVGVEPGAVDDLRELQRGFGNIAVRRLVAPSSRVSPEATEASAAPNVLEHVADNQGEGHGLDPVTRARMEAAFGRNLRGVRIHTGANADDMSRRLGAFAFTIGLDIFFRQGSYAPRSTAGAATLGHELMHTVQHGNALVGRPDAGRLSAPDDASEREASAAGTAVASGDVLPNARAAGPASIHRQEAGHPATAPGTQEAMAHHLIDRYTSWIGNLDESGLGQRLWKLAWMSPDHYGFVLQVLNKLDSGDRDDVTLAFIRAASRPELLDEIADSPGGIAFLDRLYQELTSGWLASEEEAAASRVLTAWSRRIPLETYMLEAQHTFVLPIRAPGPTVYDDAPIEAKRLANGNVYVKTFSRVEGTAEFRDEVRTWPPELRNTGRIELPPERIVGVRLYDEGGKVTYLPALGLIGLSSKLQTSTLSKIGETVLTVATLGTGTVAEGAKWGARALLWADRAATAIGVVAMVVNDHRGWLLKTFPTHGKALVRACDIANSLAGVYGIGRLSYAGYKAVANLRESWLAWRAEARALGRADEATVLGISNETEKFIVAAEETRAAILDGVSAGTVKAPGPADVPAAQPAAPSSPAAPGPKGPSGATTPASEYDQMPLQKLRKLARKDKAAAEALVDRYWLKSDAELRRLAKNDQAAQAVLRQRTSPNDAALAKALGSDYRPPHSATVAIRRPGAGEISRGELHSGNMTAEEAALGYPQNTLATHTEARAVRRPDLQRGDTMTIIGQYDPCSSCIGAMRTAASRLGITIHYMWMGGFRSFRP